MPFLDHLEELRWRIVYSVGALFVGMMIGFFVVIHYNLIDLLIYPIKPYLPATVKIVVDSATGRASTVQVPGGLVFMHGADPITITMQLAFGVGFALGLPVILYQLWSFLAPALHKHERRTIKVVLAVATLLFAMGVALAFFFAVPQTFSLSQKLARGSLTPMFAASEYFGFLTTMSLTFGLAFEVPILLVALTVIGVLTPATLAGARKYAALIVFIGASLITPGDAVTATIILAVPLYILFECSIVVSAWLDRRKRKRRADEDASLDQNPDYQGA